jgi:hypothetical protein
MLVALACNTSYLGGRDQENQGSRPAQATKARPYLKNTQYQKYLTSKKALVAWLK